MNYNSLSENVKSRLDMEIGIFVLEDIYSVYEFDLLDTYSVIAGFVPANYIPCRENYLYNCF